MVDEIQIAKLVHRGFTRELGQNQLGLLPFIIDYNGTVYCFGSLIISNELQPIATWNDTGLSVIFSKIHYLYDFRIS